LADKCRYQWDLCEVDSAGHRHTRTINGIPYDVIKLQRITRDLPIVLLEQSCFQSLLNRKVWGSPHSNSDRFSPLEVVSYLRTGVVSKRYVAEVQNEILPILKADMQYPILLTTIDGVDMVLDGMHRLAKAYLFCLEIYSIEVPLIILERCRIPVCR